MTRRDTQITWLIRFSAAWTELPDPDRQPLAGDPWALKEFTGRVDAPSANSAQMALLHLAHPDTFEPIVSADHKQRITSRFADAAGADPDVDRRLLAARAALTPRYGEGFDWYQDWLVRLWWKDQKIWQAFLGWLNHGRTVPGHPDPDASQLLESGDETFLDDGIAGVRRAWQLAGWGAEPDGASFGDIHGRLLHGPRTVRERGHAQDMDMAGADLDHDIQGGAGTRYRRGRSPRPGSSSSGRAEMPARSDQPAVVRGRCLRP
jgi:hypothetical protein